LPETGQQWWREHAGDVLAESERRAAASRAAAEDQKLLQIH
jgi:lysine 2,3-aminomutase